MGLFSNKELSAAQAEKLNALLPKKYQQTTWKESDFGEREGIYVRFSQFITHNHEDPLIEAKEALSQHRASKLETLAAQLKIFNTEPYQCVPIGMVDVGRVHAFTAATTGERFAGGLIGYAIESAADKMWTKGNAQEKAVNQVKLDLLKKAHALYPDGNLIFKFEIDFREMGSSGNVFVYARGTVCKGKNKALQQAEKKFSEKSSEMEEKVKALEARLKTMREKCKKVPKNKAEISSKL